MSLPEEPNVPAIEQNSDAATEETYCYRHKDVATKLSCSRCGRPICGKCATPAVVGQHCPECVGEARKSTRQVRSALVATAPVVVALIAANVVIYFFQFMTPGNQIEFRFGQVPGAVAQGEYYRLLTATFLHSPNTIFHIMMNMLVLGIYGPNVEQAFGHVRFLAMYLVSGFFASAVSYAFGPCNILGVGASGAIFGVVGVLLVYLHNRSRSQFVAQYRNNLLVFVGLNVLLGFAISGIDWRAHLGGLAAGALLALGLDSPRGRASVPLQIATLVGVTAIAVVLVVVRTQNFTCV